MSERTRVARVRTISWSRRQSAMTALKAFLVLGAFVVAAASFGSWAGSSQNCVSCHRTFDQVSVVHEGVECVSCHVPLGVTGTARFGASWARMAAVGDSFELASRESVGPIDESACIRCHRSVLEPEFAVLGGIRVEHAHLWEQGVACSRCHAGMGHQDTARAATRHTMSECMRCHGDGEEETRCSLCHTGNPSDVVSDRRPHAAVVAAGDGTCGGCHEPALARECVACHGGYEMPHPADWVRGHLYDGFVDQDACFECHAPPDGSPPAPHGAATGGYAGSFCNRCHSYPTPHPPASQWVRQHGAAYRGTFVPHPVCRACHGAEQEFVQNCYGCHHTRSACDTCHAQRDARRARR